MNLIEIAENRIIRRMKSIWPPKLMRPVTVLFERFAGGKLRLNKLLSTRLPAGSVAELALLVNIETTVKHKQFPKPLANSTQGQRRSTPGGCSSYLRDYS